MPPPAIDRPCGAADCRLPRPPPRRTVTQRGETEMQLNEIMNHHVARVTPVTGLRDAAHQMWALNAPLLAVCDGNTLVGVLTTRDLIVRAAAEGRDPQTSTV